MRRFFFSIIILFLWCCALSASSNQYPTFATHSNNNSLQANTPLTQFYDNLNLKTVAIARNPQCYYHADNSADDAPYYNDIKPLVRGIQYIGDKIAQFFCSIFDEADDPLPIPASKTPPSSSQISKNADQSNSNLAQERLNKRTEAYTNPDIYETTHYTLTDSCERILAEFHLEKALYQSCCGNQIQQVLHAEFVDIISDCSTIHYIDLKNNNDLQPFAQNITSFAHVGQLHNHANEVIKATTFADYCWTALDLLGNVNELYRYYHPEMIIAEGIQEAFSNTIHKIFNPRTTLIQTIEGLTLLGNHIAILITEYHEAFGIPKDFFEVNLQQESLLDFNITQKMADQYKKQRAYIQRKGKQIANLGNAYLNALNENPRNTIKKGGTIATEIAISHATFQLLGTLFSEAGNIAGKLVSFADNPDPLYPIITTADGLSFAIASEAVSAIERGSKITKIAGQFGDAIRDAAPYLAMNSQLPTNPNNNPGVPPEIPDDVLKIPIEGLGEIIPEIEKLNFNSRHHILAEGHEWERFFYKPTKIGLDGKIIELPLESCDKIWKSVKQIMTKVFKEGIEEPYKKIGREIVLKIENETVSVIFFRKPDQTIHIGNAWIQSK